MTLLTLLVILAAPRMTDEARRLESLYDQVVGKAVYWDKTGAMKGPPLHDPEAIGDILWALITSPEFQYVK